MSIATQISRLTTLRNNIRTKLIALGIISSSTADLEDCYNGINGITGRTSSDLTVSGATVSAPKGYYNSAVSKSIANGSVVNPATNINLTCTIQYDSEAGIYTAGGTIGDITPTVTPGYVSSGTSGALSVLYSGSVQPTELEENLIPENIADGITIFGVTGTHMGGNTEAITIIEVPDGHGGTILQIVDGINLSEDTVTAATLLQGYTAHDKYGNAIVGTATGGGGDGLDSAMYIGESMPNGSIPNIWHDISDEGASVSVSKVWYGTQSSYNDISNKESDTLYCIMSEAQVVTKMYRGSTVVYEPVEYATVTGTAPLELVDAEVDAIVSLVQYGKCTVSNGEIICNNGVVKVDSKNRLYVDGDREEIKIGGGQEMNYDLRNATFVEKYYISSSGAFTGENTSDVYVNIPSTPGATYTWSFIAGRANNRRIHEFASMEVSQLKTPAQNQWLRQKDLIAQNSITVGQQTSITWTASNDAVSFSLPVDKTDSNTVLHGTFSYYETASVENLFAVGDYKDSHDIIAGKVHRECGICKYDGSQSIGSTYLSSTGGKDIGAVIVYPLVNAYDEYTITQELHVIESSNTITATAEISGITFKATYIAEES